MDNDHDDDDDDGKTAAFEEYAAELVRQLQAARAVTDLDECHSLWKQLTIEARSLEPKQMYLDRCQVYKSQIQAKKLALERSDLLSTTATGSSSSSPTKDNVESKLARQNVVLDQSLKRIHETEDLAGEIANNLHTNRATIQNVKQNTATLTSLTDQANQLADRLLRPWWKKI
jgi:hypothetical protein